MKWFHNWKTGRKLAFGFGLCLLLSALIIFQALTGIASVYDTASEISHNTTVNIHDCYRYHVNARRLRVVCFQIATANTAKDRAKFAKNEAISMRDAQEAIDNYASGINDARDRELYQNVLNGWGAYTGYLPQMNSLINHGEQRKALDLLNGPMRVAFLAMDDAATNLMTYNEQYGVKLVARAKSTYGSARNTVILLFVLAVLIGGTGGLVVTRYITGTLRQVADGMESLHRGSMASLKHGMEMLAAGDLAGEVDCRAQRLDLDTRDEFGALATTYNGLVESVSGSAAAYAEARASLSGLIRHIQQMAGTVALSATELSSTAGEIGGAAGDIGRAIDEVSMASEQSARAASEVAQGASSQAMALTDGVDQVRDLTTVIHQVADEAKTAADAADRASEIAGAGAEAVEQSLTGMRSIQRTVNDGAVTIRSLGEASDRISAIIETIGEIAEQTNLLALNAAIEAAPRRR